MGHKSPAEFAKSKLVQSKVCFPCFAPFSSFRHNDLDSCWSEMTQQQNPLKWHLAARELITQGCFEDAAQSLSTYVSRIRLWEEWKIVFDLLEAIPENTRSSSPRIAILYAKALTQNQKIDLMLDFTSRLNGRFDQKNNAEVLLIRSGGFFVKNDFSTTLHILEDALPFLSGESRGRALGRLGLTLFQLGEPWEFAFAEARNFLTGRNLGLMYLNLGYCLGQSQRQVESRAMLTEALSLLKSDPYSLAWIRYNLGTSCIGDLEIVEAERHFLEGERLSINPKSFSMRSSILSGLANVRKARGEWSRAEFTYREAFRTAIDSFDRVFALTGLTRTFLLSNRFSEANETLELELHPEDSNNPNIQIVRALVYLHLNDAGRAKRALESISVPVVGTYQWLERIARAELARRDGLLDAAVALLEGLPIQTLHAREEVRLWPELFALLQAAGKPVPLPLEYLGRMLVRVTATGILRVTVNDRSVPIPPVGRAGELLVFLLEQGGAASLEAIREALFPEALDSAAVRRAGKTVWFHAENLRKAFGWDSSVTSLGRAYQLDPDVTWQYDVAEARERGAFQGEFLKGVYSEWALEVGRELEMLPGRDRDLRLN
jgi:tetratricopeptide (TPR) repeat protein